MKSKLLFIATISAIVTGCAGFEGDEALIQSDLTQVNLGSKTDSPVRPQCEVDYADYLLDSKLMGFELTTKSNVSFGFNILKGFLKALGFSLKSERGVMTMTMQMSESHHPLDLISHVTGEGESKTSDFNVNVDFIKLGLDVGYYYKTPISKLTEKTLDNTLAKLQKDMSKKETPWSTKIVNIYPGVGQAIIPTGSVAGIKEGDLFEAYNVDHLWAGEPCYSEYLMPRRRTNGPAAIYRAGQVEKNATLLYLMELRSEEPVEVGAMVRVSSLVDKRSANSLLRAVRLRDFQSHPLPLGESNSVDLSLYISEQTKTLLNRHGYYPRH